MKVYLPNNFLPERKYIVSLLLGYLDLDVNLLVHEKNFYLIEHNNKQIFFYDYFFTNKNEREGYLNKKNLPQGFKFLDAGKFYPQKLPVLYGENKIISQDDRIIIYGDIFASAFFLLTRWEEKVIKEKDEHNRFPDSENFLKKHGLHYRPVVCEYITFLKNLMGFLGIYPSINQRYSALITHDVDIFERYDTFINFFKATVNDIRLRKSPSMALNGIYTYARKITGQGRDPYDTFDYLMDISEKYGLKSHFYFIPSLKTEPWAFYDYNNPKVVATVKHILERGHIIGLHGSYRGYNDEEIFVMELDRFRSTYGISPEEGRQHFLRFENPVTWRLWDQNGLRTDSTLGFSSDIGFRAGMCYPYRVFDVEARRILDLTEIPLIVMDGGIAKILQKPEQILNQISEIKQTVKTFNGSFVFLWHPNSFVLPPFDRLGKYYEEIIKILL